MTVQEFLQSATETLRRASIESARLDVLLLLEDALGQDRAQLLAHPETNISQVTEVELNTKIAQRTQHIPLAYIRGKAEFYGREFTINEHVLVPRPETEAIIELLKKLYLHSDLGDALAIDIGTGSGAIATTAKLELPDMRVIATDIDPKTLAVARQNAKKLAADIEFRQGDLLEPLKPNLQNLKYIILANLPYVPTNYPINKAASHEPKIALFAGTDGLDAYRCLWQQVGKLEQRPLYVFMESLTEQHDRLTVLAKSANYELTTSEGLIQQFKHT